MKYLAIDIGSSFLKAAVLDMDSCLMLAEDRLPSPARLENADPRRFEAPAEAFLAEVREAVDVCARHFPDLSGLLLSTQMHGFVYSLPGRPDIYVSWRDSRSLAPGQEGARSRIESLRELFPPVAMERAGMLVKPSLALCNLSALLAEERALPRNGVLHTLGSYIIKGLTGENACHFTNAAALGFADLAARDWDRKILARAGLGEVVMPKIAPEDFQACGTLSFRGGEIPVYPDYGDQQVAILGCLPQPGDAIVNVATGAQVATVTEEFRPGPYETRPYFEGRFIRTISDLPSGRGLAVLVNFVKDAVLAVTGREPSAESIWKAARDGFDPDTEGLSLDLSFYPRPGRSEGGSISGITPTNLTLGRLFAAAFRNMAAAYWESLNLMLGGPPPGSIICAGGVSRRNPELLAAISGLAGRECRLSSLADESMSGFFRIALACAGISRRLDDNPELLLKRRPLKEPFCRIFGRRRHDSQP